MSVWIKLSLSIALASIFVYFAVRGIDFDAVWASFSQVHLGLAALSVAIFSIIASLNAYRFRLLVSKFLPIPLKEALAVQCISFLAISLLPFRLGEFTRPMILRRRHNARVAQVLSSCVIERTFDGTAVGLVFAFALIWDSSKRQLPLIGQSPALLGYVALIFFGSVLAVLFSLAFARSRILVLLTRGIGLFPEGIRIRLQRFLTSFADGLDLLRSPKHLIGLMLLSFGNVILYGFYVWAALFSFGFSLPFTAALFVFAVVSLGNMLPNSPGFVGTYHFFCKISLMYYGISDTKALGYAIFFHALNLGYIAILGVISLIHISDGVADVGKEIRGEMP